MNSVSLQCAGGANMRTHDCSSARHSSWASPPTLAPALARSLRTLAAEWSILPLNECLPSWA